MSGRPVSLTKWKGGESLMELCKSFMYKTKSRGPRTDPCRTPQLTLSRSDEIPSIETYCILFVRGFKQVISYSSYCHSFFNKISWSTVSNAFLTSIKILHTNLFLSNAFLILSIRFIMVWTVEKFFLEPKVWDKGFFVQLRISLICYALIFPVFYGY